MRTHKNANGTAWRFGPVTFEYRVYVGTSLSGMDRYSVTFGFERVNRYFRKARA